MVTPNDPGRILALDALRGIAVIGIVGMNVHAFALPGPAYYNPLSYGGVGPLDHWVWLTSFIFVEDKFRTLFAMLFGAGCLILLERGGQGQGARPWRAHYARMAVLFAIGLVHATVLASNDVLRAYALAGLALPLLAGLTARALIVTALGFVLVHLAFGLTALGGVLVDFHMEQSGTKALLFAERQFGRDPAVITMLLEQGREGLGDRIARRSLAIPAQLTTLLASLPLNLAAMALAMAAWNEAEGFAAALVGPVVLVISAPFDMLLAVSYAALAMSFLGTDKGLTHRLAMVGRLSLTNYLMTSVILSAIFASWGMGLFGEVTRWQSFALGLVPVTAMLAWSPPWVARLGQGPFERLWRAGARLLA